MPNLADTSLITVRRVNGLLEVRARDSVAVEDPLEIQVAQERRGLLTVRSVSVTMRTPGHDDELAIGFLFGEGLLNQREDLESIESPSDEANLVRIRLRAGVNADFKRLARNFYAASSCGICGKASLEAVRSMALGVLAGEDRFRIGAEAIHQMAEQLRRSQEIFGQTGGLMRRRCLIAEVIFASCGRMSGGTMRWTRLSAPSGLGETSRSAIKFFS